MQRLLIAFVILIATLSTVPSCAGNLPEGKNGSEAPTLATDILSVRGLVMDVTANTLTDLTSLTVRAYSGGLWTFTADEFVGMTPSHLMEHRVLAQPVTVSYKETPNGLVVLRITD